MTATMTYQQHTMMQPQPPQQAYYNRSVSQPQPVLGPPAHAMTPEQLRMRQQAEHADKLHQYRVSQRMAQQNGMMPQQMMMEQQPQRPGIQRTPSNSHLVNVNGGPQQRQMMAQQQHSMSNSPFPVLSNPEIAAHNERRMQNDRAYMEQQRILALQQQAQMQGGPPVQQQQQMQHGLPIFPAVNGNQPQQQRTSQPIYSRPPSAQASQYPANNPPQLQNMTSHQQQAFHAARERVQQNGPRPQQQQAGSPPPTSYTVPVTPASSIPPARSSSLASQKPQPPQPIQVFSANGIATMRLLQYTQALARATEDGMEGVKKFCSDFYTDKASIKMICTNEDTGQVRSHEIPISVFPRLMAISYKAGARSFGLIFESPQETQSVFPTADGKFTPTGHFQVDCPMITHTTQYANGTLCISVGSARYHLRRFALPPSAASPARMMASGKAPVILKIEYAEMRLESHQHLIVRPTKSLSTPRPDKKELKWDGESDPLDAFTTLDEEEETESKGEYKFPDLMVNKFGVAPAAMDFMEVSEMIHNIGDLIYTTTTENIGPQEALSRYASLNIPSVAAADPQPSRSAAQQLGIRIPDVHFDPGPSSAPIISASYTGPTPAVLPPQHACSAPTSPATAGLQKRKNEEEEDLNLLGSEGLRGVKRVRGVTLRG